MSECPDILTETPCDTKVCPECPYYPDDAISFSDWVSQHDNQIRTETRNTTLKSLLQIVKIREDEMSRKANLTENMTTATGYFTSAGALNWVVQEIEKSLRTQSTKEHP